MSDIITIDTKRTSTLSIYGGTQVIVTATGEIEGQTLGIASMGSATRVSVAGYVHSTAAGGLGMNLLQNSVLSTAPSGRVFGDGYGVRLVSGLVENEGSIGSNGTAVMVGHGSRVDNTGSIQGGSVGVHGSAAGIFRFEVVNAGTIAGTTAAIEGVGSSHVVNDGHLEGQHAILFADGDDFYDGRGGTATGLIAMGTGNDTAYGGAQAETFDGGEGDDVIDGGGGSDTLLLAGHADLRIDLRITERQDTGQGADVLRGIENVHGGNGADLIVGSAADNTLTGHHGDDTLEGGQGNDRLEGGAGTDTVRYAGSTAATVSLSLGGPQETGHGRDTLVDIENLEGGSAGDRLTGNNADNLLRGNGGNDTLTGGAGNDTLDGGGGSDTAVFSGLRSDYTVTANADGSLTVSDSRAERDGADTLTAIRVLKFQDISVARDNSAPTGITLSRKTVGENEGPGSIVATLSAQDAEGDAIRFSLSEDAGGLFRIQDDRLVLAGTPDFETRAAHTLAIAATDAFGASTSQRFTIAVVDFPEVPWASPTLILRGTPARDALTGGAAHEAIYGLGGNDRLRGGAGDDRLFGGKGKDVLNGGSGRDAFVFDTKPNKKNNLDRIVDFNRRDDSIWLDNSIFKKLGRKGSESQPAKLKKAFFTVGQKAKDKNDHIVYDKKKGILSYDLDGAGGKAGIAFATVKKNLKITAADFFVI